MREVLRVQDEDGRGPYRPGFSHRWSDPFGPEVMPWWIELGESMEDAHRRCRPGFHWGCGFRTVEQFHAWFSRLERAKLARLGFALVQITPDIVAIDTPSQVVFGTLKPLSLAKPRISLTSHVASEMTTRESDERLCLRRAAAQPEGRQRGAAGERHSPNQAHNPPGSSPTNTTGDDVLPPFHAGSISAEAKQDHG